MAVELLVLSGARQGARFKTSSEEFRAGGTPQCELVFDPDLDKGARDRVVSFRLKDDGWTLHCLGPGEVLINDTPVASVAHLRSGDVVRLSQQGPDFSFQILGRTSTSTDAAIDGPTNQSPQTVKSPDHVELSSSMMANSDRNWSVAAVVVGVVVVLMVSVMTWRVLSTNSDTEPGAANPERGVSSRVEPKSGPADTVGEEKSPPQVTADEPVANKPAGPSPHAVPIEPSLEQSELENGPWWQVFEEFQKSLFLLAVEQPKTFATWPFASCCAIGEHTLLTSGNVVTELAKFQQQGWKLWAINEPAGIKTEIQSLRVHVGYVKSGDEPDKRIYFDLGLVNVGTTLPKLAALASPDALAELEPGFSLACIGITHEAEALNRFASNEPELHPAKIFIVTTLPPPPGPRLLHFRADLPIKPYGSPLVNLKGQVCAVYVESAAMPAEDGSDLKLHYAPVIDPALIEEGFSATKSDIWVAPVLPEPPTKP